MAFVITTNFEGVVTFSTFFSRAIFRGVSLQANTPTSFCYIPVAGFDPTFS
jgi:hypothetical protein